MELRQLEYFSAVCEQNGFSRAAESLYVTQPTITMSVKKLEEELGVELYNHRRRDFELTEAGEVLRLRAAHVLEEVRRLSDDVDRVNPLRRQELELAIPSVSCSQLYALVLGDYANANPNIKITVHDLNSSDIISMIEKEDLELGFCAQPNTALSPNLEFLPFGEGRVSLLMPKWHPLAEKESIFPADLSQETLLFAIRPGSLPTVIEQIVRSVFEQADLAMPEIRYFHDQHTLHLTASLGYGIYCFTETPSVHYDTFPDTAVRRLEGTPPISIGLVYNKKKYLSLAARHFISFFLAHQKK